MPIPLQLCPAITAEFGTGRVIRPASRTFPCHWCCRSRQIGTAVIAELHRQRVLRSAVRTGLQLHRSTAVITKLSRTGGLPAGRANGGLALDLAFPDGGGAARLVDIPPHGFRPRLGDIYLLAGRTGCAEPLVLVEAGITDVFVAGVAAMKVLHSLVLRVLKRNLVFLLPFGGFALEAFGQDVPAALGAVGDVPDLATDDIPE